MWLQSQKQYSFGNQAQRVSRFLELDPLVDVNFAISRANTKAPIVPVFEFVVLPLPAPSHSKHLYFSPKPRLFAVVCGIDDYKSRDFPSLRGAVADAVDVLELLLTDYQVPRDHIRFLANEAASRLAIISALQELSADPRIRPGDPILFYFAGHGSEIYPPEGWECGGPESKIQVLVPQDYCSEPGLEIPAIPDCTIGFLLDEIAHSKGDNIVSFLLLSVSERLTNRREKDCSL